MIASGPVLFNLIAAVSTARPNLNSHNHTAESQLGRRDISPPGPPVSRAVQFGFLELGTPGERNRTKKPTWEFARNFDRKHKKSNC
jgi:hypothetical protein